MMPLPTPRPQGQHHEGLGVPAGPFPKFAQGHGVGVIVDRDFYLEGLLQHLPNEEVHTFREMRGGQQGPCGQVENARDTYAHACEGNFPFLDGVGGFGGD